MANKKKNEILTTDLSQATGGTYVPPKPKRDGDEGRPKELTDEDLEEATGGTAPPIERDGERDSDQR